ncbi:MAG TPA: hypothetical protein VFF13_03860 [archaeon]|nr:hypothetical protein [archaeon]
MNWKIFVKDVEPISVPKIKSSKLGYAAKKNNLSGSSTLLAYRDK